MITSEKTKFVEKESFKHKLAKELLVSWLNKEQKTKDLCSFDLFKWRCGYGIHSELKFYETSDPYYFVLSKGINKDVEFNYDNPNNSFIKNFNRGKILFVPDITIFHKGHVAYFIEIVHTNETSIEKLSKIIKFFKGDTPEIYEIQAEEILKQIDIPESLKFERIL